MKKKILFLFLFLNIIFFVSACQTNKEEFIMVTEAGFAPYEYYEGGEITGIDVEIAKEIASSLNKKLVIKDVAFDSIINEVKTEKSDLGAAGISYTKERAMEVDFTINYMDAKEVIVVKKGSFIKGPDNLQNVSVAVQLGSVGDTYITENYPQVNVIREKKYLAAIQDLKDDKVNAVVMDEIPAKKLITEDMQILNTPLVVDHYGMIVKKGNTEVLNAANKVIDRMKKDGSIDKLFLKHMKVDNEVKKGTSIKDKFYNSIIYNGRYKYIITGLKNTLVIALGAVILGIIFGTITALIRNIHDNTGNLKIASFLASGYVNIIRGTPVILQLMIIYYVIFKQTNVNIVLVGIMAFGINSGAYVSEIIRAGINSVDKGQVEAGYALGLHYKHVMGKIVLPQAIKNILPALGNEFITLVKETSVGAYIGIVELTKASDIIASRTYDYFFPLIIIALIYLLITVILSKLIRLMEVKLNHARS